MEAGIERALEVSSGAHVGMGFICVSLITAPPPPGLGTWYAVFAIWKASPKQSVAEPS